MGVCSPWGLYRGVSMNVGYFYMDTNELFTQQLFMRFFHEMLF